MLGPVESATDSSEDSGDSDNGGFGSGFGGLVDTSSFVTEPLIEEPVASGGDSSLWTDGEDGDEECPVGDPTCEDGQ